MRFASYRSCSAPWLARSAICASGWKSTGCPGISICRSLPAPVRSRVHIDTSGLPTVEWARAELADRAVRLSAWRRQGEPTEEKPDLAPVTPGDERNEGL